MIWPLSPGEGVRMREQTMAFGAPLKCDSLVSALGPPSGWPHAGSEAAKGGQLVTLETTECQ